MSEYQISMTIESSAQFSSVEIDGFNFKTLKNHPGISLATRSETAEDWANAAKQFNENLLPILDALTLYLQSATSAYMSSAVMTKKDSDIALVSLFRKEKGRGNSLWEIDKEEISEVERLAREGDFALESFQHAALSTGAYTTTSHLLQCVERLAGTKTINQSASCNKCSKPYLCKCGDVRTYEGNNRKELERILGADLYKFFYIAPNGKQTVRNLIAHGGDISLEKLSPQVEVFFKALSEEFKNRYSLEHMAPFGIRSQTSLGKRRQFIKYEDSLPDPLTLYEILEDQEKTADSNIEIIEDPDEQNRLNTHF
jgi:hypothetical protein